MELKTFQNTSSWKWVQLARGMRTKTPVQHHILQVLVQHADIHGKCWPSYQCLMDETGYRSKTTIANALVYLRDELKVLTWNPGHGNQFKHFANLYQFDQTAMVAVLKQQKKNDESTTCTQ